MISSLARKVRNVRRDPVLRRWLVRRLTGREPPPPAFEPGRPPYLGQASVDVSGPRAWSGPTPNDGDFARPGNPVSIRLAGETVTLSPDDPGHLFARRYDDLETLLSAHRFAWVPVAGAAVDADWVAALWRIWADRYGEARGGWPWHAYTAAERAINIIDFAWRHGLPGERERTLDLLLGHAAAIAGALEYYGEHYTSNHLSNNGRGLLRIGIALQRPDIAKLGLRIMTAEASRIFGRSGMLREGSTHYHMLLARNYVDAWMAAERAGMDDSGPLRDVALRALGVLPTLRLPGGMPLVGDISPDCPPAFLGSLHDGQPHLERWPGDGDSGRDGLASLVAAHAAASPDRLASDGWHRFGDHGWAALAFVPPDGWPPMPGHGHDDMGSFEIHWTDIPVLVDPGRGSYRDTGYVSATMHNGIVIDGAAATPENRPYYSDAYRRTVVEVPPSMTRTRDGRRLVHHGFSRLKGLGAVTREWRFATDRVEIVDRIEGRGRHTLRRQFCTPLDVTSGEDGAELRHCRHRFRLALDAATTTEPATRWTAYGDGTPATLVVAEETATLPCERRAVLERVRA